MAGITGTGVHTALYSPSKFFQPVLIQETLPPVVVSEEDGDWWSGVWNSGLAVAIVTTISTRAGQTTQAQVTANLQQDDPAGNLTATVDEYFWINPAVSNVLINEWPQQFSFDPNEIAFIPVVTIVDEDFWQNPVSPAIGASYQTLPLGIDDQTPFLFGQFDEDFWQNPVLPVPGSVYVQLPIGDPEEIPAGSLHGQYDEDFWQNPTFPVPGTLYVQLPYWFDANEIASGHGQYDEDFWINPAVSCLSNLYQKLPLGVDEQTPLLHGQFDEDFWNNPAVKCYVSNFLPIQWGFDQNEALASSGFTSFATDSFSFSDTTFVTLLILQLSQFPDTILLDMASDTTYPVPYQRGCIQVLLFRRFYGRNAFEYVTPQQAALRTAAINALFDLRTATNSAFALLLAQEENSFNMFGI